MKVLVTGAGALLGQGIIRSLMESSLSPVIVAADANPLSAGLYWTRHRHLVPMASDPARKRLRLRYTCLGVTSEY